MSNKDILEQAITKAIAGGWAVGKEWLFLIEQTDRGVFMNNMAYTLIFNHDFAKGLWGEEGQTLTGLRCSAQDGVIPYWQYHLQQMVIADDPIQYLGENLPLDNHKKYMVQ